MRHPAYHLRTNKAVDRLLLVAVLRKLDPEGREFTYYSFGGPFLEDLRIMDHFFPEMKLVSLEANEQTFKRQEFNKFSSRIELKRTTLADFLVHDYEAISKAVFWLDYTDLKYSRLIDFQSVLTKVLPGSVVRITLRAEPEIDLSSLEGRIDKREYKRLQKKLAEAFQNEFDKVLVQPLQEDTFESPSKFALTVQQMIQRAASYALDQTGSKVEFMPLQSTRYNDGTQMLSVTGIVAERTQRELIQEKLKDIRFANFDWHSPELIDIPALSMKEQLHLQPFLPVSKDEDPGEVLFQALKYMIDNGERRSKKQLAHYADCQRDYPNFIRISV